MQDAISLFTLVMAEVAPYAVVFSVGQWMVRVFLKMGLRGEVKI